ncbi:hypothetical protein PLICRDRAFT_111185 [Plicaturopsis crispa FD-325 SS-3]|nr:hypothetical protein PLICRDRAFT_111185 [Plicaturopsis crispa FD-325 SS-3]
MALRRFAHTKNAATGTSSPLRSPRSPQDSPGNAPPVTPRPSSRISYVDSPSSTPSVSSSMPFDWDAARNRKPPPYATPIQGKRVRALRKSEGGGGSPRRAYVKRKGLLERISSLPSWIAFEIALFPHNVPLPAPKTSAWLIAGSLHFLHLCVRISQIRSVPDADLGWEDMYREGEGTSWFDWTVPVSFILVAASVLNVVYLFTRIRFYRLHQRADPVSSPHAKFVPAELDFEPLPSPSLLARVGGLLAVAWRVHLDIWRWLLNMSPRGDTGHVRTAQRVQQLEVWAPGELEITLFTLYSPAHALLWMATNSANWMLTLVIMAVTGAQLQIMTRSYEALIKDKEIIAAEVMHEYNEGFVYPRINPIRRDVAVMTHQSEMVNIWED